MAGKNQEERWTASLLAGALAVAGVLFVLDKIGSLIPDPGNIAQTIVQSAPALLVTVGICLVLADLRIMPWHGGGGDQGGRHHG